MRLEAVLFAAMVCLATAASADVGRVKLESFDPDDVRVEVHLPHPAMFVQRFDGGMEAMSPLGAALGTSLHDRRIRKQSENVAALDQNFDRDGFREALHARIMRGLAERESDVPGSLDEPPSYRLAVGVEYYLTPEFRTLRFRLTAEGRVADAAEAKPAYHQRIYLDVPAPKMKGARKDDQYGRYWASLAADEVELITRLAADQLGAMLAWDMGRRFTPVGYRPGKRYGIFDSPMQLNGLRIHEADGRRWVRVDNGYLLNLPLE